MKRKILCLFLSFIFIFSYVINSFFVYSDDNNVNDFLEVDPGTPIVAPSDGNLLDMKIDKSIDEDFLNDDKYLDDEDEAEPFTDKKEYSTLTTATTTSSNNSLKSRSASVTSADNNSSISLMSTESQYVDDMIEIVGTQYKFDDINNWLHTGDSSFLLHPSLEPSIVADYMTTAWDSCFLAEAPNIIFTYDFGDIDYLNPDNYTFYIYPRYDAVNGFYVDMYSCIISNSDVYLTSKLNGTGLELNIDGDKTTSDVIILSGFSYSSKYKRFGFKISAYYDADKDIHYGVSKYSPYWHYCSDISLYNFLPSKHKIFVNGEEQNAEPPDPYDDTEITGQFLISGDGEWLGFNAQPREPIEDENLSYDVQLYAVDGAVVPTSVDNNAYNIVSLKSFYSSGTTIDIDCQSIYDEINLEEVYYYTHQMKSYDDSVESVNGYNFKAFESREDCTFVIAYRKSGNSEYTICADYTYDYSLTIDNQMGSFTVKKDYVDFPDINDYIDEFPSVEDFLPDGEDPGVIDWILAYVKWIGACLKTFGHNFLGFFRWLKDCVPIIWTNLGIALYNLVCDIKSLFVWFFKPKTKAMSAAINDRIPGFESLKNALSTSESADLPSFKIYGTKFGIDFSNISDDVLSKVRSVSSIIFYVLFGVSIILLVFRVFGFSVGSSSDDTKDD